jgi:hypothetical protein
MNGFPFLITNYKDTEALDSNEIWWLRTPLLRIYFTLLKLKLGACIKSSTSESRLHTMVKMKLVVYLLALFT